MGHKVLLRHRKPFPHDLIDYDLGLTAIFIYGVLPILVPFVTAMLSYFYMRNVAPEGYPLEIIAIVKVLPTVLVMGVQYFQHKAFNRYRTLVSAALISYAAGEALLIGSTLFIYISGMVMFAVGHFILIIAFGFEKEAAVALVAALIMFVSTTSIMIAHIEGLIRWMVLAYNILLTILFWRCFAYLVPYDFRKAAAMFAVAFLCVADFSLALNTLGPVAPFDINNNISTLFHYIGVFFISLSCSDRRAIVRKYLNKHLGRR